MERQQNHDERVKKFRHQSPELQLFKYCDHWIHEHDKSTILYVEKLVYIGFVEKHGLLNQKGKSRHWFGRLRLGSNGKC